MTFHSLLLTILHLWKHLRMEFSYHNSYVMPEIAITAQTFCTMLNFLQLSFWNKVTLLQVFQCHHELMDHYGVSIYTMRTTLFNVILFSFPLSSTLDLTLNEQLGG